MNSYYPLYRHYFYRPMAICVIENNYILTFPLVANDTHYNKRKLKI